MSRQRSFRLKGDDYSQDEIEKWYSEEADYHNQFAGGRGDEYWSIYETFNRKYVFDRFFAVNRESKVLSFGCAEGIDLEKTYRRSPFQLFGVEASRELVIEFRNRFPDSIIREANSNGSIEFPDGFFDYVIVLGVLHHIPNVSFILEEIFRVLADGGILLMREPISSMRPTSARPPNLSPNERGIPVGWLKRQLTQTGFEVLTVAPAFYSPLIFVVKKIPFLARFSTAVWYLDRILCKLPSTDRYKRTRTVDKFAPGSAYFAARKRT